MASPGHRDRDIRAECRAKCDDWKWRFLHNSRRCVWNNFSACEQRRVPGCSRERRSRLLTWHFDYLHHASSKVGLRRVLLDHGNFALSKVPGPCRRTPMLSSSLSFGTARTQCTFVEYSPCFSYRL